MVHEIGIPMLLQQIEETGMPILKRPPTAEEIDAVIDAIGEISGDTIMTLKAQFVACGLSPDGRSPLGSLRKMMRLDRAKDEAAREDGHPDAKLIVTLWDMAKDAYNIIAGIKSVTAHDKVASFGYEFKDFLFVDFLPNLEEIENAPTDRVQATDMWWYAYAANFQGADVPRPDSEIDAVVGELSEIVNVIKAAYPLMDCFNKDFLEEATGGMASKAEDEAKKVFNLV